MRGYTNSKGIIDFSVWVVATGMWISCVNCLHIVFISKHAVGPNYTWTVVKMPKFIYIPWACGGGGVGTGGFGGCSNISIRFVIIYVEIDCINVVEKGCLCVCGVFDVSVNQSLQHWLIW